MPDLKEAARNAKAQKVKERAAKVVSPQMKGNNGKPSVQSILAEFFTQITTARSAAEIIEQVEKATGRVLKESTLQLYRHKWASGGFGSQKGVKPKTSYPPFVIVK